MVKVSFAQKPRITGDIGRQKMAKAFRIKHKFEVIPRGKRLEFLVSMARKWNGNATDYWRMRRSFDAMKASRYGLRGKHCYVCGGWAHVRHHVIPLAQNGRNKQNNIVPLCSECHAKVHPWL